MTHNEMFERCVERRSKRGGRYEIRCILGNFSVDAPTNEEAEREAKHYFGQYFQDGEYDQILHITNNK